VPANNCLVVDGAHVLRVVDFVPDQKTPANELGL
jgi:hypothetical protein